MKSYLSVLNRISFRLDIDLQFEHPVILSGLEFWRQLKGDREMPSPDDVRLSRIPRSLLPYMLLIDVVPAATPRFRWRMIGTHILQTIGRDSTGCWWHEIYQPHVLDAISTGPHWVLDHHQPVRTTGTAPLQGQTYLHSENLDMPLSSDGRTIDMLMVVSIYD